MWAEAEDHGFWGTGAGFLGCGGSGLRGALLFLWVRHRVRGSGGVEESGVWCCGARGAVEFEQFEQEVGSRKILIDNRVGL